MCSLLFNIGVLGALFAKGLPDLQTLHYGSFMCTTRDGGFAVTGYLPSALFEGGGLIKLTSTGELDWAVGISTLQPSFRLSASVIQTSDGGYAIATDIEREGAHDFLVIKLNSNGSFRWAKTIGGIVGDDIPTSIIETYDHHLVVSGWSTSYGNGSTDALVVRLDENAGFVWACTLGSLSEEEIYSSSLAPGGDNRFLFAGVAHGANTDVILFELDNAGNPIYMYKCQDIGIPNGEDYARCVVATAPDNGFLLVGETTSWGGSDMFVVRGDATGTMRWARLIGGPLGEAALSATQTSDGNFVVAGITWTYSIGGRDHMILKMDNEGNLLWCTGFGGPDQDFAQTVVEAEDGDLGILGWGMSYGVPTALLKIRADGTYPNCVMEIRPIVSEVIPNHGPHSLAHQPCTPDILPADVQITPFSTSLTNICEPLYEDLKETRDLPHSSLLCASSSGGLLFISPIETKISIYYPDGRIAYVGELSAGRNRIALGPGIYLWQTGTYSGKAVVK
ncbi:MAG: hypothetical protein ABIM74_09130 [candidate division WOR-3 bacterium]